MRVFIGIKLDNNAIKIINNYYKFLYQEKVVGNFTDLDNLHLTLAFLGEINKDKLEEVIDIVKNVKTEVEHITITKLTRLKDMLIGEVICDNKLQTLHDELVSKLNKIGFNLSNDYYPHITLIRKVNGLDKIKIIDSKIEINSIVNKITVFESTRINGVLKYIPKN